MSKLTDLLFIIGLFLTIISCILLGTHFFGPSDVVQGIRVNLLGGGVMGLIGVSMIARSFYNSPSDIS